MQEKRKIFVKKGIGNSHMISYPLTYKDESSAHGRCNSTGIAGRWILRIASFIKKGGATYPMDSHTAIYFPPPAHKDRAVNSMEIKDFIILWTYSQ